MSSKAWAGATQGTIRGMTECGPGEDMCVCVCVCVCVCMVEGKLPRTKAMYLRVSGGLCSFHGKIPTYVQIQTNQPSMLRSADLLCPSIWERICNQGLELRLPIYVSYMVDRMFFSTLWLFFRARTLAIRPTKLDPLSPSRRKAQPQLSP